MSRISSRVSGRNTITLSRRFWNSGRKVWPIASHDLIGGEGVGARREAEARAAVAGGAEVGRQDDDAVAEVGDLAQLRRSAGRRRTPAGTDPRRWRAPSRTRRAARRRRAACARGVMSESSDSSCRRCRGSWRSISGVWNSLMSRRIMRSTEPNRNSATRLGELGLAGAGRAGEQEHADRLAGIVEAGLQHGDAVDDGSRRPRPGR